jgi:hypothetical protein
VDRFQDGHGRLTAKGDVVLPIPDAPRGKAIVATVSHRGILDEDVAMTPMYVHAVGPCAVAFQTSHSDIARHPAACFCGRHEKQILCRESLDSNVLDRGILDADTLW